MHSDALRVGLFETTNQAVGSSNLSGRASFFKLLWVCGDVKTRRLCQMCQAPCPNRVTTSGFRIANAGTLVACGWATFSASLARCSTEMVRVLAHHLRTTPSRPDPAAHSAASLRVRVM